MSYTKGKWEVKCYSTATSYPVSYVVESNGRQIVRGIITEADAHLIATAPRMYEALKVVEQWAETTPPVNLIKQFDLVMPVIKRALAEVGGK